MQSEIKGYKQVEYEIKAMNKMFHNVSTDSLIAWDHTDIFHQL